MKIDPYYQRQRCSPMTLDSGNIRFMPIFAEVFKIYVNFLRFIYACAHIIHVWYAVLVFKFTFFVDDISLPIGLPPVLEYRRDQQRCGKRSSGLWSAEYLEFAEKLQIFRRRYILGILTNKTNVSIQHYLVPYRLSTHSKTRGLEMTPNGHFALNSALRRYVSSSDAWLSKLGYF